MDSSFQECCSEPDWLAKFPEWTASELFPASGKSERFQELCQEPALRFRASGSRYQELEKPFPAVRFRAESFLESGWIRECWFPGR